MAPLHRIEDLEKGTSIPEGAVSSAVLILLMPSEDPAYRKSLLHSSLVVIRRNSYNGVHSGQISFPGGKYEEGDRDLVDTACREAKEELGIEHKEIIIAGLLTPLYVPPSNYIIYPVVATAKRKINFHPDPREVCGYKCVPLSRMDPALARTVNIAFEDKESTENEAYLNVPAFVEGDYIIWGATAMIISELYQVAYEAKLITSLIRP
jgi:8-oxo-dGTP pyrophosphatase MutT (NUDIX family)